MDRVRASQMHRQACKTAVAYQQCSSSSLRSSEDVRASLGALNGDGTKVTERTQNAAFLSKVRGVPGKTGVQSRGVPGF